MGKHRYGSWIQEEKSHIYKQPCIILLLLYKRRRPWIENGEHFAIHSWTWQSGMKGWVMSQELIDNIKQTRKFMVCSNGFSQGWKSLLNIAVGMINIFLWQLFKVHQKITSKFYLFAVNNWRFQEATRWICEGKEL